MSGVIGWPCILSLSVTAQACGSSSARHGEKGARFTLEKNFLPFRNIRYAFSKHRQSCDWCCCTRIFSSDRCLFDKKSNSTLLVNVAGNIARVNSVGFFIRIYIRTCDTDGYKYIYIYIFLLRVTNDKVYKVIVESCFLRRKEGNLKDEAIDQQNFRHYLRIFNSYLRISH